MRYSICWEGRQVNWDYRSEEARNHFESLENRVNEAIKNGWQPLGGVAMVHTETTNGFHQFVAQAMVLKD